MGKNEYLTAMRQAWSACQGCNLHKERKNTVFGYGSPDAQIMIIGEAPGENEDKSGLPFVGQAGMLLDQYLAEVSARDDVIEIQEAFKKQKGQTTEAENQRNECRIKLRDLLLQEFYFTNVVMCRPPENRDPTVKEIEACRTRLLEQVYTIDPVLIIAAGRIAAETIVGKKIPITTARGELFDVAVTGRKSTFNYPVMAVLHPSYLLRKNDFKQGGGDAQKTYNDFLRAMKIVDEHNLRHFDMPLPKRRPKLER